MSEKDLQFILLISPPISGTKVLLDHKYTTFCILCHSIGITGYLFVLLIIQMVNFRQKSSTDRKTGNVGLFAFFFHSRNLDSTFTCTSAYHSGNQMKINLQCFGICKLQKYFAFMVAEILGVTLYFLRQALSSSFSFSF